MLTLLWKEWRQNRIMFFIFVGSILLFSALWLLMAYRDTTGYTSPYRVSSLADQLAIIVCAYALFLGTSLIADDISKGAIVETLARPVAPLKVWLSKYLLGFVSVTALLIVASGCCLVTAILFHDSYLFRYLAAPNVWSIPLYLADPLIVVLAGMVFSVAVFASSLSTRPLNGLPGSLLIMGGVYYYCELWNELEHICRRLAKYNQETWAFFNSLYSDQNLVAVALLFSLFFAALSAGIYVSGEIHTGLNRRKWTIAGWSLFGFALFSLLPLGFIWTLFLLGWRPWTP